MLNNLIIQTRYTARQLCRPHQWSSAWLAASTTAITPSATDFPLEQTHIDEVVQVTPSLSVISLDSWRRSHETFLDHGLQTANFLRIVAGNPDVLTRSPQKISDSLELWRSCQFGEKLLHLFLTKYPEMLDVADGHRLLVHIGYLKSFAGTNKNVWQLLMNCPDLMSQTEACIEDKLEYLTTQMRLESPEIVKSEALSKSLAAIRCRHVYLSRLGLFKPRSPKAAPHEPSKNHRLYQITDTSDKTFATKICHTSLLEFESFQELFARELEHKEDVIDAETDLLSDDE